MDARSAAGIGEQVGEQACPSCGAPMPRLRGYSPWCDACQWNLVPVHHAARRVGRVDRLLLAVAERLTERRFESIKRRGKARPGFSPNRLLVIVLSAGVAASTVLLAVAGVMLFLNGPGLVGLLGGPLVVGVAWVLRPRFGSMPPTVSRDEMPDLYAVPDAVAEAVGVRPADRIAVSTEFNAAVAEVGWQRRRVLILGMPLMAVLNPEERVAVLGHEFAHYANGDPLRGWLPQVAMRTLIGWHDLLRPEGIASSPDGDAFHGVLLIPINLILLAVCQVPLALALLIYGLAAQDGQRAEFYADLLAARVAGRAAVATAWTKMHLGAVVSEWTRATTDEHWLNQNLWDELVARVTGLPGRELERARLAESVQQVRVDATHPPTEQRIRLVGEIGSADGALTIPPETSDAFEAALRSTTPSLQRQLIESYTGSLYAG